MVPVVPADDDTHTVRADGVSLAGRASSTGHAADGGQLNRDDRGEVGAATCPTAAKQSPIPHSVPNRAQSGVSKPYTTSPRTVRPTWDS